MKKLGILLMLAMLALSSCSIFQKSEIDADVVAIPKDEIESITRVKTIPGNTLSNDYTMYEIEGIIYYVLNGSYNHPVVVICPATDRAIQELAKQNQ